MPSRSAYLFALCLAFGTALTAAAPTNATEAAAKKAAEDQRIDGLCQAKVATLSPARQAGEKILQANLGNGFYLPLHKRDFVAGKSNAWDFVAADPKLPRVLLLAPLALLLPAHSQSTAPTPTAAAPTGNTLAPGSPTPDSLPDSRTPVRPEIGRWVHLAVVYDSEARTTRFFLNGRFDSEGREATAHPARLGPAPIGNWNRTDRKLSGRIDAMLVLDPATTAAEIDALFAGGNPHR